MNKSQTYTEVKLGRTLYRVTSIFTGEIELKEKLENLIFKQALQSKTVYDKIEL